MQCARLMMAATVFVAFTTSACNRQGDTASETPRADTAAAEAERERTEAAEEQREHAEAATKMEERVAELERDWAEKEKQLADKTRTATAGLRDEVKEDVTNVRTAIADLKTTTADNWWERHERAMERTAEDIEQDVRRLAPKALAAKPAAAPGETGGTPFEARRDRFVTGLRARVDGMEAALKDLKVDGARETEVNDTRARVEKLKEDLDRLRSAEADDWWEISARRVSEYIDRVEASIRRLDDNKT